MIDIYESIFSYVKENLSKKRQKHSFEVSKLAESLCKRYDIYPGKGLVAGISHDIARDFNRREMEEYAKKDGNPLYPWEIKYPILLHGRAGAQYIKEKWGVYDSEILEAVCYHTCGKPCMSLLAQILFVSDYLEPGRKFLNEQVRKDILTLELRKIMLYVLKGKFKYIRKKGREILPDSLLLYKDLCANVRCCDEKENPG